MLDRATIFARHLAVVVKIHRVMLEIEQLCLIESICPARLH
jgi:hypothetical protein